MCKTICDNLVAKCTTFLTGTNESIDKETIGSPQEDPLRMTVRFGDISFLKSCFSKNSKQRRNVNQTNRKWTSDTTSNTFSHSSVEPWLVSSTCFHCTLCTCDTIMCSLNRLERLLNNLCRPIARTSQQRAIAFLSASCSCNMFTSRPRSGTSWYRRVKEGKYIFYSSL